MEAKEKPARVSAFLPKSLKIQADLSSNSLWVKLIHFSKASKKPILEHLRFYRNEVLYIMVVLRVAKKEKLEELAQVLDPCPKCKKKHLKGEACPK